MMESAYFLWLNIKKKELMSQYPTLGKTVKYPNYKLTNQSYQ